MRTQQLLHAVSPANRDRLLAVIGILSFLGLTVTQFRLLEDLLVPLSSRVAEFVAPHLGPAELDARDERLYDAFRAFIRRIREENRDKHPNLVWSSKGYFEDFEDNEGSGPWVLPAPIQGFSFHILIAVPVFLLWVGFRVWTDSKVRLPGFRLVSLLAHSINGALFAIIAQWPIRAAVEWWCWRHF